eukprot:6176002-Pleurochrysis_carterae.AAC.5
MMTRSNIWLDQLCGIHRLLSNRSPSFRITPIVSSLFDTDDKYEYNGCAEDSEDPHHDEHCGRARVLEQREHARGAGGRRSCHHARRPLRWDGRREWRGECRAIALRLRWPRAFGAGGLRVDESGGEHAPGHLVRLVVRRRRRQAPVEEGVVPEQILRDCRLAGGGAASDELGGHPPVPRVERLQVDARVHLARESGGRAKGLARERGVEHHRAAVELRADRGPVLVGVAVHLRPERRTRAGA